MQGSAFADSNGEGIHRQGQGKDEGGVKTHKLSLGRVAYPYTHNPTPTSGELRVYGLANRNGIRTMLI
ncbi:hypothetical protein TUM12151_05450 [Morganella morganii]|nr:hypothetical protein TUM12149_33100 [Morganella morganii]GIZ32195.1 hypothetical protein TUM12150_26810 [Morganella morganii]GIZ33559.1 hypothetical protein TUM12151_05450 [Morganella morganii]